jgi:hypothetical protein
MSKKTPVARISEGAETPIFKDLFSDWPKAAAKVLLRGSSLSRALLRLY